jgi:hypothetical protein
MIMKKLLLHRRNLLFALCLIGCLQTLAVPGKRTSSSQFLSTFAKKFLPAHYQSPFGKPDGNAKAFRKGDFKFPAPPLRAKEETTDYPEIVTPPPGLVTEKYLYISFIITSDDETGFSGDILRRDDHEQELLIGFDGPDIYIQGLSTYFPDAWIKCTLSEDQKSVNIPPSQYLGTRDGEDGTFIDCYFMVNYDETHPVNYNKEDGSFTFPLWSTIYEEEFVYHDKENRYEEYESIGYVSHRYPQIVKGVLNDDVITPPSDLVTKEYLLKNDNLYGNKDDFLLEVGYHNDDVYIRGLFPALPDAWIRGKLSGNEIIFPKWQFLGESREIGQFIGKQYGLEDIGSKKLYLYGFDQENLTFCDVVFKYDKDNDTMSGNLLAVGASRVFLEFAVFVMQNIVITPISDKAVTPSAPEISEFTMQDSDYAFTFRIPVQDIEGNGMTIDLLYYRILTEIDGQISTISFKPAEYETLREMISLIPYRFTDGKFFTSQYNYNKGHLEKKVILKSSQFTSLNKIGVQSVYHGGGTTNESEVSWLTAKDAIELLWSEIMTSYKYYYNNSKSIGKKDFAAAIDIASTTYDELTNLDEEAQQSYNIILIFEAIQSLKAAEEEFLKLNARLYNDTLSQLVIEIDNAYELYDNEGMSVGKEELLEAITHAEQLCEEVANLDEDAFKEYDMSIIINEINVLQEAEQTYLDLNEKEDLVAELEWEISNAYELLYDENNYYERETFHIAISHAQEFLEYYYSLDEEELEAFDMSRFMDEIQTLLEAEQTFLAVNNHIYEDEWQILKNYYQSVDTSYWNQEWDFSSDLPSIATLPGVESYEGHIIKIDLTDNNIVGTFPYEFLTLPYLEELILSENDLKGDIGDGITQFIQKGNLVSSNIRYLDISYNRLSGNIGPLANALTGLEYLDASGNRLDEVTPVIPKTVTTLYLNEQNIQSVVDLHIQDVATGTLLRSVPNILRYNHDMQTYDTDLSFEIKDSQYKTVSITMDDESFEINDTPYAYMGENGAIMNAKTPYYNYTSDIFFPIRLYFDEGDADFNGLIDILDLQTQIDYIVNDYNFINYTAANLWKDNTINVQDAVCMVNLLLDRKPSTVNAKLPIRQRVLQQADGGGQVFVNGGKLFLNTNLPVAAFDIVISSDNDIMLSSELTKHGLACGIRKADGQTHLIGYSLSGGSLPEGLTEIGSGLDGEVVYAMLASKNAREIPVELNLMPTDISITQTGNNPSDVRYIIPLGTNHAIYIDANKKKTIHNTTK